MTDQTKRILLISCYELGHQPAGLTMPLAFLKRAGYEADSIDLSVEELDQGKIALANFIGISVPMHTALRLGVRVAQLARSINPDCHICFYGLYASLNADYLLGTIADSIVAGEFEQALLDEIDGLSARPLNGLPRAPVVERLDFPIPDRVSVPPLSEYARLEHNGTLKVVGYTEASRGCLHLCTHCPIPPVYGGRFFVVPREVVLEDVRLLVASGAEHITFGDPDFLNGPLHSLRIAREMHMEFQNLTFDFTAKIEHLIAHSAMIEEFAQLGCIFIVSAVESLSDVVLEHLQKGHNRLDVVQAFDLTRRAGIALRPSLMPFTPWATLSDFGELLEFVETHELIYHVDPVQYTIRLLIPPGSYILRNSTGADWLGPLVQDSFTYAWKHPDPGMDELHHLVSDLVERAAAAGEDAADTFGSIRSLACTISGKSTTKYVRPPASAPRPPRLTESWFCCAEPTRAQLELSPATNLVNLVRRASRP
jgi:radical SAM superfamily enzyme YgiQ (UPF0313 family)